MTLGPVNIGVLFLRSRLFCSSICNNIWRDAVLYCSVIFASSNNSAWVNFGTSGFLVGLFFYKVDIVIKCISF